MIRRWGPGLCSALIAGLFAIPASAVPAVQIRLNISFLPANPIDELTGAAVFYKDFGPAVDLPPAPLSAVLPPIDLNNGSIYSFVFYPTDPCFGAALCGLDFSFGGTTSAPNGFFGTAAFLPTDTLPSTAPNSAPILPIGTLTPTDPCRNNTQPGDPCRVTGNIVAFDDPVIVGAWEVTMSFIDVAEPNSVMLLIPALASLLALPRLRR